MERGSNHGVGLLEHPDVARRDLQSLRSLTVGGAPVHAELLEQIRSGLPSVQARIATGYGLTENGGQATAASGRDTAERPGSKRPAAAVRRAQDRSAAGIARWRDPRPLPHADVRVLWRRALSDRSSRLAAHRRFGLPR